MKIVDDAHVKAELLEHLDSYAERATMRHR